MLDCGYTYSKQIHSLMTITSISSEVLFEFYIATFCSAVSIPCAISKSVNKQPELHMYNFFSSKNTLGVKKAWPSKVESYLEVNT